MHRSSAQKKPGSKALDYLFEELPGKQFENLTVTTRQSTLIDRFWSWFSKDEQESYSSEYYQE